MTKATIQYRQMKAEGALENCVLKPLITESLERIEWVEHARDRVIDLDQDGSVVILNKISAPETWDSPVFAGQLIQLQSGADIHAILDSLDSEGPEFLVQSMRLGEDARVLKGILYFVVVGNHVGIIESQQVKGRTLERYLSDLLQQARRLEPGQALILMSKFVAGNGMELSESTEITVAAAPTNQQGETVERRPQVVEREAAAAREHEQATVFDILRQLGWSEEAIEGLGSEIPEGGWVEGFFKVFIKSRNKKRPISRATINEALRNVDPADLGMRGNGSEKGGIVKLSVQRDVRQAGSLIDPADAMEQITNALRDWAMAGKIDCDFGD